MRLANSLMVSLWIAMTGAAAGGEWQPQAAPLMTRWAKDVTPDRVHPEYPRPQMVREQWQNLNGLWEYAVRPQDEPQPQQYEGRILVPFPIEAALSGVMKRVDETQRLWYRRTFEVPAAWAGQRVLLHFGAVDWEATVWVNGQQVGTHCGGYDPFTFDITPQVRAAGPQELVVSVWDPTDAGPQPRGKQVRKPEGIWYTPTTGIWQTVWLEPVPEVHVARLETRTHLDGGRVWVYVEIARIAAPHTTEMVAYDGETEVARSAPRNVAALSIPNPKLWSPETPHLYNLKVTLRDGDRVLDEVWSYFGLREVTLGEDSPGTKRILLNGKPIFMHGLLDQGFWPDGLYTAPTDEALRYDIEMTKRLGFNTARKHVKVEPDRWYYWCDKLGLLVWQDMPSGDRIDAPRDWDRTPASAGQFERELRAMIRALWNHPSIVMWVPFNEGWGQYNTQAITAIVSCVDPTRPIDSASGWHDTGVGDVCDIHVYPGPGAPRPEAKRAGVLGEFGGLGLPVSGHTWLAEKSWGYRSFKTADELTAAYVELVQALRPLIADPGLSAAIYTQTTDVEIEINGLLTYDRAVVKMDAERVAAANRQLYGPPPRVQPLVPTSEHEGVAWRYTTESPADGWQKPGFADQAWQSAPGGFGQHGTPGIEVRTEWKTPDIWLRREFALKSLPSQPYLQLYHDEDCEVFINGRPVAAMKGYTTSYRLIRLAEPGVLRTGRNVIALHCHQTTGGQGVDAGLVDLVAPPE